MCNPLFTIPLMIQDYAGRQRQADYQKQQQAQQNQLVAREADTRRLTAEHNRQLAALRARKTQQKGRQTLGSWMAQAGGSGLASAGSVLDVGMQLARQAGMETELTRSGADMAAWQDEQRASLLDWRSLHQAQTPVRSESALRLGQRGFNEVLSLLPSDPSAGIWWG